MLFHNNIFGREKGGSKGYTPLRQNGTMDN